MNFTMNITIGGIRTADLWWGKLPLYCAYTIAPLGAILYHKIESLASGKPKGFLVLRLPSSFKDS